MLGVDSAQALGTLWATQLESEGLTGEPADPDEVAFAEKLIEGVSTRLEMVDRQIEQASVNWRLSRMPLVDRNILRIAAYELLMSKDVPASVSINEAVELAKTYGDKDSRAFVNGILDRVAQQTGRGGRGKGRKSKKRSS